MPTNLRPFTVVTGNRGDVGFWPARRLPRFKNREYVAHHFHAVFTHKLRRFTLKFPADSVVWAGGKPDCDHTPVHVTLGSDVDTGTDYERVCGHGRRFTDAQDTIRNFVAGECAVEDRVRPEVTNHVIIFDAGRR